MIHYSNYWDTMSTSERDGGEWDLPELDNTHLDDVATIPNAASDLFVPGVGNFPVSCVALLNHSHTSASNLTIALKDNAGTTTYDTNTRMPDAAPHSRWQRHHVVVYDPPIDCARITITPSEGFTLGRVLIMSKVLDPEHSLAEGWSLDVEDSGDVLYNSAGEPRPRHGRVRFVRTVEGLTVTQADWRDMIETGGEMLLTPDTSSDWNVFRKSIYGTITATTEIMHDDSVVDHSTVFEGM